MTTQESPYVFRASEAELVAESDTLKVKEAHMADGMIVRYQERGPGGVEAVSYTHLTLPTTPYV